MLPKRKPKDEGGDKRWRSPAHTGWVTKTFSCAMCGSNTNVVFAHYRYGSHTGMQRKPDDWRGTPLCDGPFSNIDGQLGCHDRQHVTGEPTFWAQYEKEHGQTVHDLIDSLCNASPKKQDIARIRRERGL